jgi:hypothetical protein
VAFSKTILVALVTPATCRVVQAACAGVVPPAQVGDHRGVVLLRALLEVRGPVHALAVREGCQVGIPVDTHLLVVAPHAEPTGAVLTAVPVRAGHGAVPYLLLPPTPLLTLRSVPSLLLCALLLTIPPALV